jgi:hypothetical protein
MPAAATDFRFTQAGVLQTLAKLVECSRLLFRASFLEGGEPTPAGE